MSDLKTSSSDIHNDTLIQAVDVYKEYKSGERNLPVLNGINIAINKGEIVVIVGASGAGKSTLLHILGALDTPTSGAVFYKNKDLSKLSHKSQAEMRNRIFGFERFYSPCN